MNQAWLVELYKVLANEKRLSIIKFCQKPHTVSEIIEELQISRNKTTDYLSRLHNMGLISKTRNDDRTVTVQSKISIKADGGIIRHQDLSAGTSKCTTHGHFKMYHLP